LTHSELSPGWHIHFGPAIGWAVSCVHTALTRRIVPVTRHPSARRSRRQVLSHFELWQPSTYPRPSRQSHAWRIYSSSLRFWPPPPQSFKLLRGSECLVLRCGWAAQYSRLNETVILACVLWAAWYILADMW